MRPILLGAALLLAGSAHAQTLTQRIAAVRDGEVRFRYAARAATCGDGERMVRLEDAMFIVSSRGGWTQVQGNIISDQPCRHGLAEARLSVRDGAVISIRSTLPAPEMRPGARDLGIVPAADAARYFLSLIGFTPLGVDDQRVFLALVLADSTRIWPDLVGIARNASLSESLRGRALSWSGYDGDPALVPVLAGFLRDASAPSKIRSGAASGLSRLDDPAALRTLLDYVSNGDVAKLRATIVHIVGGETAEALPAFRRMAADPAAPDEVRGAIFLELSESENPADGQLLRSLLPKIESEKLKDRLLHSVSERDDAESARWLLQVAMSTTETVETRRKALFWAGQSEALPLADLVAVYPRLTDRKLKEHFIFVLHDRDEDEATDHLIRIARTETDTELRKKAFFWLSQRKDEKSVAFFREVISK